MCAPELRAFEVASKGEVAAAPDGSAHAKAKASIKAAPLNVEMPLHTAASLGTSDDASEATLGERFADCVEAAVILVSSATVLREIPKS